MRLRIRRAGARRRSGSRRPVRVPRRRLRPAGCVVCADAVHAFGLRPASSALAPSASASAPSACKVCIHSIFGRTGALVRPDMAGPARRPHDWHRPPYVGSLRACPVLLRPDTLQDSRVASGARAHSPSCRKVQYQRGTLLFQSRARAHGALETLRRHQRRVHAEASQRRFAGPARWPCQPLP